MLALCFSFFVNGTRWMGSHQGDIKINIKVVQGWQENKSHPSSTKLLTCLVRGMRSLALCNTSQQTVVRTHESQQMHKGHFYLVMMLAFLSTDFTAHTYLSFQSIGVIVRYSQSIAHTDLQRPPLSIQHITYSLCLKYLT